MHIFYVFPNALVFATGNVITFKTVLEKLFFMYL